MSTVLLVLCHPDSKSFNHAVAKAVATDLEKLGHSVLFHDLYAEGFEPTLSLVELRRRFSFDDLVQKHYRDLESSDGLVLVHPEWWSQPPAMLKGWVDRVLRPGIGYEFEGEEFMPKSKVGLLSGKRALILATTDSDSPRRPQLEGGDPSDAGNKPQTGGSKETEPLLASLWRETFRYCGITEVYFRMLYATRAVEPAERHEWIDGSVQLAARLFPRSTP